MKKIYGLIPIIALSVLILYTISFAELSIIDIKIGYVCQTIGNEMTYSYRLFNGKEALSIYGETGQTIEINTDLNIQQGKLHLIF